MSKSTNKVTKIQDGEFGVESPTGRNALLRKIDGVWTLMALDSDAIETHTRLKELKSYKKMRSFIKDLDLDAALDAAKEEPEAEKPKAERADRKMKVWLGGIAADFMGLSELDEKELAESHIASVRFTKAWVHITFASAQGMTEMANSLAELEPSDSRTRAAVQRAIKTLRDAAAKATA